jgi:hypothetical protein
MKQPNIKKATATALSMGGKPHLTLFFEDNTHINYEVETPLTAIVNRRLKLKYVGS